MIDPAALQASARRARWILDGLRGCLLALLCGTLLWAGLDLAGLGRFLAGQLPVQATLVPWQTLAIAALGVVQLGFWFLAITSLSRLLRGLAGSDAFPPSAAGHAGRAARWMWVALLWTLATRPLGTVLGTWNLGAGERLVSIEFSTAHLAALIAVIFVGCMAQALGLAAALWQDHREIV